MARSSRFRSSALALFASTPLLFLFACGGGESDGGTQPGRSARSGSAPSRPKHPVLGETLAIDGQEISHDRVKAHLATSYGSTIIEARKIGIFVEKELARRAAAGEDVSEFTLDETELDTRIAEVEDQLREEYPDDDVRLEDMIEVKDREALRTTFRQSELFQRVYLPKNPNEYPPLTVEALSDPDGELGDVYTDMKEGWDRNKEVEAETGKPVEESPADVAFMKNMLQGIVLEKLTKEYAVKYVHEGLPEGVVLRVGDVDVTVDEIWSQIEDQVTPLDVYRSKQWIVNTTIAQRELEKEGFWMTDEEYEEAYSEHHEPYKDSPFNPEILALNIRKFPSIADYQRHFRIIRSFENMIEEQITDDALEERIDRLNLYASGLIDADVILLSAYDFKNHEWKENGWEDAELRAIEVTRKLAEGMPWDEALTKYTEFYEMPQSKSEKEAVGAAAVNNQKLKGRFLAAKRNEVLRRLEDNDYQKFLDSSSLGEFIFFDQEMGTIQNPFRGKYGYYIPKLTNRVLTSRTFNMQNENHRDLLRQDYVRNALDHWIYGLRDRSLILGLNFS